MEVEIEQIIFSSTRIAEEKIQNISSLNDSYAVLTNKKSQLVDKKYNNLEKENSNLNERIRMLTAEIDDIRLNTSFVKKNQTTQLGGEIKMIQLNNHNSRIKFNNFNNMESIT